MLTVMILATTLNTLPTCKELLREYESQLAGWSQARREVTETTEEHRYHTVSKKGVTTLLSIVAALPTKENARYVYSYEASAKCLMDNREATIYYKVLTK